MNLSKFRLFAIVVILIATTLTLLATFDQDAIPVLRSADEGRSDLSRRLDTSQLLAPDADIADSRLALGLQEIAASEASPVQQDASVDLHVESHGVSMGLDAGAAVIEVVLQVDGSPSTYWTGETDPTGRVRVPIGGVPALIVVRKIGHVGETVMVERADIEREVPLVVQLLQLASLRCSIVLEDGRAARSGHVFLTYQDEPWAAYEMMSPRNVPEVMPLQLVMGADGVAQFVDIVPGHEVVVGAMDPSHGANEALIEPLEPGETRDVKLILEVRAAVRIEALDPFGAPIPFASVAAVERVPEGSVVRARQAANEHGVAVLAGLNPGHYDFSVSGWNLSNSDLFLIESAAVLIASTEPRVIQLQAGSPKGSMLFQTDADNASARQADVYFYRTYVAALDVDAAPEGGHSRREGSRIGPVYRFSAPIGRTINVWMGCEALCRVEAHLTVPGRLAADTDFSLIEGVTAVPGELAVFQFLRPSPDAEAVRETPVDFEVSIDPSLAGSVNVSLMILQEECLHSVVPMRSMADGDIFNVPVPLEADWTLYAFGEGVGGAVFAHSARSPSGAHQLRLGSDGGTKITFELAAELGEARRHRLEVFVGRNSASDGGLGRPLAVLRLEPNGTADLVVPDTCDLVVLVKRGTEEVLRRSIAAGELSAGYVALGR
jgi:hypothetical protein